MEFSIENPFFEGFPLILDLPNIKNETYNEILSILKYSPSLVDDDIISIAEEIILRIQKEKFLSSPLNVTIVKNLFSLVKRIPDTRELQYRIRFYYSNIVSSPISSPVSPPPIPKKMKKSKCRLIDKVCPC
jgi:hypothetical protein